MNRLPGISQNPYPLDYLNSPIKKARTDQEKQPKSPIDIQLEQATNTFNVAVTLLALNRKRRNSVMSLLPRDICREIVKMTFPRHLKPASKNITDEEFSKLISKTPLLKSVDISKCWNLKAESVIKLAKRSHGLESIKCQQVSDAAVKALANYCRLKDIDIAYSLLTEKSLETLGRLRELTSLYFRFEVNENDDQYFEALSTLVQQLPKLEKYKGGANNAVLIALANKCQGLTHLKILESVVTGEENCVTNDAFKTFARQCSNIRSITLQGLTEITNETLSALAWNCHNLQSVKLYSCNNISDRGVVELTEHCTQLKKLVVFKGELDHLEDITDESVYAVNKNLVDLRHFGIGYYNITDEAMIAFAQKHSEVTKLSLDGTPITDATLYALATHCHKLVEVSIGNTNITENGVEVFIKSCPHLKKIFIFGRDVETWQPFLKDKYPNIKFPF